VPDMTRYMDVQQAVGLAILKRFEEEGIEMPYPTHSVLIDKMPQTDKAAS